MESCSLCLYTVNIDYLHHGLSDSSPLLLTLMSLNSLLGLMCSRWGSETVETLQRDHQDVSFESCWWEQCFSEASAVLRRPQVYLNNWFCMEFLQALTDTAVIAGLWCHTLKCLHTNKHTTKVLRCDPIYEVCQIIIARFRYLYAPVSGAVSWAPSVSILAYMYE